MNTLMKIATGCCCCSASLVTVPRSAEVAGEGTLAGGQGGCCLWPLGAVHHFPLLPHPPASGAWVQS